MSPPALLAYHDSDTDNGGEERVPSVVVVDPRFDSYKPLAASARLGKLILHFRSSGAEAIKLARRMQVDAWLVAPELDDISGHDFVELLRSQSGASLLAMVETAEPGSSRRERTQRDAVESGAQATLTPPITFSDLERLLGLHAEDRSVLFTEASPATRAFVTLPIGVSAAAVAIAVLMLG
ncbi:MAG: hypothetical protein WCR51_08580 [Planctomycetia bacterium]